eukprot:scaffold8721_cov80-Phaeocystis_antarctica.AAC.41
MDDVTMRKIMNRSKCLLSMMRWQRRRAGLAGAKRHSALSEAAQPVGLAFAFAFAFAFALASALASASMASVSPSSSSSSAKASSSTVMNMLSSRKRPTTSNEMKNVGATGATSACAIMMSNHEPDMTTKVVDRRLDVATEAAAEECHAQQREDERDQSKEHQHVAHLRDGLGQGHADLVQALPRLHQSQHAQHAQHAKDAQERNVRAAAGEGDGHSEIEA